MARPQFKIELQTTLPNGFDQAIQTIETVWHLTYNGKLAKIRMDCRLANGTFKYKKSCWANEQMGWTQVEKLKHIYNDDGFGLIEIKA